MRLFFFLPVFLFALSLPGQEIYYTTQNAHSHNDYEQKIPFWMAYDSKFGSIEADIFLVDSNLIVAHDKNELKYKRSFSKLYLKNLDFCLNKNRGYPYKDSSGYLQLLIDIKTDSIKTLKKLIFLLEQFPTVIHNRHVYIVITGNRPNPNSFSNYPDFIWFDGVLSESYTRDQLLKVKMLSDDFRHYSHWRGEKQIPIEDVEKLRPLISEAHQDGIAVRLWDAPDFANAWTQLMELQVDYINTDHISALAQFLQATPYRKYQLGKMK
jgi:alkaline phosphatase